MRVPFEFAEPGTDPTQQENQIYSHETWTDAIPWIGLLGAILIGGYALFFRGEPQQSQAKSPDTATPAATETVSASPTTEPTSTPTVAATEVPSETGSASGPQSYTETKRVKITDEGECLVRYAVLAGDSGLSCTCDKTKGTMWAMQTDEATEMCKEHKPEVCR